MKAAKNENYNNEELECATNFYKDAFDHDELNIQLGILSSNIPSESA